MYYAQVATVQRSVRENEFQLARKVLLHDRISPRISLKCKVPTCEQARQGDKCASFETEFREPSFPPSPFPRVRKRARAKRSIAAGGEDGGQGGKRGEVKGRSTKGVRRLEEGKIEGAKGNYPKTRYLDWTPWGARRW